VTIVCFSVARVNQMWLQAIWVPRSCRLCIFSSRVRCVLWFFVVAAATSAS